MPSDDTIVALATPRGESAVALVRLSGVGAIGIATKLFRGPRGWERSSRRVALGRVIVRGREIDSGLAWVMRAPNSYTGEDVVEISCHGSMAVVEEVVHQALSLGARVAERGEFTRRAFMNGKLDLLQVEAVLALIRAGGRSGALAAHAALSGRLSERVRQLGSRITAARAQLEVTLDFPDELQPARERVNLVGELGDAAEEAELLAASYEATRRRDCGAQVVLVGRPNVGKSTLLNALLGEDRAIVAGTPGTTRDLVEGRVWWDGELVRLIDTAGIRDGGDEAEMQGVRRAMEAAGEAAVAVLVVEGCRDWTEEDTALVQHVRAERMVVAVSKIDLAKKLRVPPWVRVPQVEVSGLTGEGVARLASIVRNLLPTPSWEPRGELLHGRQQRCMMEVAEALRRASGGLSARSALECCAADLVDAERAIDELLGVRVGEDVLDCIFREFCIGK